MFRSALDKLPRRRSADAFMTAASPGIIATTMLNAHYDSHEAYVFALARQMRKEYELIARDFILQIDAPDLALERTVLFQDKSVAEFLKIAEVHVAALNEALAGIPRERIRLHCCWGNYDGPAHPRRAAGRHPAGADPGARSVRSASSSPTLAISTNMPR